MSSSAAPQSHISARQRPRMARLIESSGSSLRSPLSTPRASSGRPLLRNLSASSRSSSCSARGRPSTRATRYPLRTRRTRVSSPTQARRHRRGTSSHPRTMAAASWRTGRHLNVLHGASGKSRPVASRKCAPTAISASRRRRQLRPSRRACPASSRRSPRRPQRPRTSLLRETV